MDVGSTNDKIIIAAYVHTVSYKMIMTKEVKYGKYDFNFIRQACIMYLHGYFNIMSSITTNSFQQINDFNNLYMNMINRYLEKETQDLPIVTNRSEKLSSVGCWGNTVGGNLNSSSRGFKAELTA